MLIELVPKPGAISVPDPYAVGNLSLSFKDPATGTTKTQTTNIVAPNKPDAPPVDGYFFNDTVEKGFVMLNIYAGFKLATQLAADSDPRTARRTLEALRPNVSDWLVQNPDLDIQDDLVYVDKFIANLMIVEQQTVPYTPADPPNPWPAD